ncbi:MAG: zinc ribbon domain-containing protein [Solirubrobacteraceae bacterium]
MRICERCGTPNDDSARFCDNCGTILPDPMPPEPPPAGPGAGRPAGEDAPTRIHPAPGETVAGAPGPAPPPAYGPPGPAPPPAYGPPAGLPPTPPGQPPGGWQGPPAMHPPTPPPAKSRSTLLAIVVGLVAFLVVGAAGAGAYFAFKDDGEPGKPTSTEAGTTPTSGTESATTDTTTDGTTDTTSSKPDKPAKFRVNVCGRLSPARRCGAPGFDRSGNVKRFYVRLEVLNAPQGKAVRILLTDASTGKNLLSPTRYVTSGAKKSVFTLRVGGGPFGRVRAAIDIKYKRDVIKFKPPLRLNLR